MESPVLVKQRKLSALIIVGPDEWEICWIAVAKQLHRHGIGKMLFARML